MKHWISCKNIDQSAVQKIFARASEFKRLKGILAPSQKKFEEAIVALLFIEPSTRTRLSFEVAATRFGAKALHLYPDTSSLTKGETLSDTVNNLYAIGCRYFVVRHSESFIVEQLAKSAKPGMCLINAGDGTNEHPTQAMLDAFTIIEKKGTLQGQRIAILGDILRSRVARSNMHLLTSLGATVHVSGPKELLPNGVDIPGTQLFDSPDDAVRDADVVMALRIQRERGGISFSFTDEEFLNNYGITPARLALAKKDALVMHPGPMQRGVEIDSTIADGVSSLILKQTENGVFVRMAILEYLSEGAA